MTRCETNTMLDTENISQRVRLSLLYYRLLVSHRTQPNPTQMSFTQSFTQSFAQTTHHFSYWLLFWFILFVIQQLYWTATQTTSPTSPAPPPSVPSPPNSTPTTAPPPPPTPFLPNPFYPLLIAALFNLALTLYTIGLYATGALTTRQCPNVWLTIALYVIVNSCIKGGPLLMLWTIPGWGTYRIPGEARRSLVWMAVLFVVWLGWLGVCRGGWGPVVNEPSLGERVRKGVGAGEGPLMKVLRRGVVGMGWIRLRGR